jgi:hypothetical protein
MEVSGQLHTQVTLPPVLMQVRIIYTSLKYNISACKQQIVLRVTSVMMISSVKTEFGFDSSN